MLYPTKKLGEVCDLITRGISPKYVSSEGILVLNQKCIRNHEVSLQEARLHDSRQKFSMEKLIKVGDVLVNSTGVGTLGRVALVRAVEQPTIVDSHVTIVRPIPGIFEPAYFGLTMAFVEDLISQMGTGSSGQTELSRSDLKKIEIPVPPVGEQRKIVAKIEKQFKKIDAAARLRAESETLADQLLSAALSEIFSSAESKGWQEVAIGDKKIMQMTSGGTPSRSNSKFYGGKIAWLKSGELNDNTQIEDSEEHITNEALRKSSAKMFPTGTILLAMYGATAGKLGILVKPSATNQAVTGLTPNVKYLDSKFLYYCLSYIREQIVDQAWGGAQPNLSQTILKTFKIPLPPLAEQKRIVKKLDALAAKVRTLRDLQSSQAADLKALKQSILHNAFQI